MLRVAKTFPLTLGGGQLTCAEVVATHLRSRRRWVIASAGTGSKGERDYAWAWIATASARHWLLIRRHLATGECAYHYCHVPWPARLPQTADHRGRAEMAGRGEL